MVDNSISVKIKQLRPSLIPQYQSKSAVGADLYAAIDRAEILLPGEAKLIPTGIAVSPERNDVALLIFARSGLSSKYGICLANGVGVVDPDYRGEIKVALKNTSKVSYTVSPGDRIAQLAVVPFLHAAFEVVDKLDETERGEGGFGSTGMSRQGSRNTSLQTAKPAAISCKMPTDYQIHEPSREFIFQNMIQNIKHLRNPYAEGGELKEPDKIYMVKNMILASASDRRREILQLVGINPEVVCPDVDEQSIIFDASDPERFVREVSVLKNRTSVIKLKSMGRNLVNDIVLSADTVVVIDGMSEPLGKPQYIEGAKKMLRKLSGKKHRVITGVTLYSGESGKEVTFSESTTVYFRKMNDEEIHRYIMAAGPFDKAGAYGIQDPECDFVERIEGDFYNVVGLPIERIREILCK